MSAARPRATARAMPSTLARRRLLTIVTVAALAAALLALRQLGGSAAPAPAPVSATAATTMAAPALPVTSPPAPAPVGAPAASAASGALPAFASADEALATRDARRAALPGVLQAMDASAARLRGDIAALQAGPETSTALAAKTAELERLLALRAQLLARNADVSAVR